MLKAQLDAVTINNAQVPVVANINAEYETRAQEIKKNLIDQVTGTVLWEDSINKMIGDGIRTFIEVGPGKVLMGLIKKIDPSVEVISYVEA